MTKEAADYFYELFEGLPRGGPGDNTSTRKAFSFLTDVPPAPLILDVGCGPGMQTRELARLSPKAKIIALDNHQAFLDTLMAHAAKEKVDARIVPRNQSMKEMDFPLGTFDVIWSEGVLFIMGFREGVHRCRELLKSAGYLAATEAVLLRTPLPQDLKAFWDRCYPAITDVDANLAIIREEGFQVIGHFTLPKTSWIDAFYAPMKQRVAELKDKYSGDACAQQVYAEFETEIKMFTDYADYYGYEFFIARKNE